MNTKKGFTLLELLIVIGILAILSTTVVLVINPAELLRRARDSQRISDLNTLKSAITLFIAETGTSTIGSAYGTQTYSHVSGVSCGGTNPASAISTLTNGTGWIPINFDSMAIGSPISALPVDPNASTAATGNLYYVYLVGDESKLLFKLVANMESATYSSGPDNVEGTDGGNNISLYEVGTKMDTPITTGTNCFNGA